jgi:hypothetical protein
MVRLALQVRSGSKPEAEASFGDVGLSRTADNSQRGRRKSAAYPRRPAPGGLPRRNLRTSFHDQDRTGRELYNSIGAAANQSVVQR